jgi:hypothetical protein
MEINNAVRKQSLGTELIVNGVTLIIMEDYLLIAAFNYGEESLEVVLGSFNN